MTECQTCGKHFEAMGARGPKPKQCPECRGGGLTITKAMYGWTKYGGAREGLVKEELEIWYCQACGSKMPKSIPAYMIPFDELRREFIRVCPKCQHKGVVLKITHYETLIRVVRK
jgi:NAD-dependent SIR2 family protein deacetylase